MIDRLSDVKMLRRNAEPEPEVLAELWHSAVSEFTCQQCGQRGMTSTRIEDDGADWGQSRKCEGCGQQIATERLEIFPDAQLCTHCQERDDQGAAPAADVDFCPHCGDIMQLRAAARGGTTGYRLFCPACRRSIG